MKGHLLLVTLGPVQEFIAQARRSRDLWFGSHLLSELSRATAREMAGMGVTLVFPSLDAEELLPCEGLVREKNNQPPLNVANKILAVIPAGVDPQKVAEAGRKGALQRWQDIAAVCRDKKELLATGAPNFDKIWQEQVDSFVEFLASWVGWDGGEEEYTRGRAKLESAIAGRKGLREFSQITHQRGTVYKSSLDGTRETVMADPGVLDGEKGVAYQRKKTTISHRRWRTPGCHWLDQTNRWQAGTICSLGQCGLGGMDWGCQES